MEAPTPWAGASLLVELFRRSGVDAVANRVLPAKGSAKGLKQGQTVESFVLLSFRGDVWKTCSSQGRSWVKGEFGWFTGD